MPGLATDGGAVDSAAAKTAVCVHLSLCGSCLNLGHGQGSLNEHMQHVMLDYHALFTRDTDNKTTSRRALELPVP